MKYFLLYPAICICLLFSCNENPPAQESAAAIIESTFLQLRQSDDKSTIEVLREGESHPIITQVAKSDHRPYLHPIVAPDGKGMLTEYSPGHHKHQTGLYWGFTRVNGRDYFHHPEGDYWKKVSSEIIDDKGKEVTWRTVYHLLGENQKPIMEETQTWSATLEDGEYILDLDWQGKGLTDITIGEYDYGGLFLRMPWTEGIKGEVENGARQKNSEAEGQRAPWLNVSMQVAGRDDLAHVTIFDNPDNEGFPQTWRVDGQLGVGPVRARMGDWHIAEGETETIKHRIICHTGTFSDTNILEKWKSYLGRGGFYTDAVLWGIAQEEGKNADVLSPEEAVAVMTGHEDYEVNVWAAEPMITQPMAFCWDDRGRLWVAENRDYESRSSGFSGAGNSRILILEDTDHDGKADSKKVFLEGIPFPAGIAVGFDGVFLGAPPNLLFVPDRDGDDVADMDDIEVRLTGWGIRDRHETLNSFHWGPDGWLYGCEGFATPSMVRKPKDGGKLYSHNDPFPEDLLEADGVEIDGGVWRYHPIKDRFEVVAHGFSNPWGIDYDAKGQIFISACVIPHLFHIVPGGIYQRQGGQHINPYVYSDIQTIVDHRHRSAHGGARIYNSDAYGEDQMGRIFMCNIHEHAVLSDILENKGSGFVAHHGDDFIKANNARWIGFSMELGPAGNLYVLDWHDGDICGKSILDQETGRIFSISPKESRAENWEGRYDDLNTFSDLQLAQLQESASSWHARRARVILQNRVQKEPLADDASDQLEKLFSAGQDADHRLRALWTMHVANLADENFLTAALDDADEYIRAWSVQLLAEDQGVTPPVLDKFATMAQEESSPVVRLYLASAMQRLRLSQRWDLASHLIGHEEDQNDHNIPHMLWFAIEPLVAEDPERALSLAEKSRIPSIAKYIARRTVDAKLLSPVLDAAASYPQQRLHFLEGMRDGLQGKADLKIPTDWQTASEKLGQDKRSQDLLTEIGQLLGDQGASEKLMASLSDQEQPIDEKQQAVRTLAEKKWKSLQPLLPDMLDKTEMQRTVINAMAQYEEENLGRSLLEQYFDLEPQNRAAAIQTLASNPTYGSMLFTALKDEFIPRTDIPQYVARQLRRVNGNGFVEYWGPIDEPTENKQEQYQKYRNLLTESAVAAGDYDHGEIVFQNTCGSCHQMHGQGGLIGPELTGSNRTDLEYLLSNIIEPSSDIQDDYKMMIITTRSGRTIVGNIAGESETTLSMRVVNQDEPLQVALSEIQSREQLDVSLMPEGIFGTISEKEIVDLVHYLQMPGDSGEALD